MAGKHWRRLHPRAKRLPRQNAPQFPVGIEREYGRDLGKILQTIQMNMRSIIIPALPGLVVERNEFRTRKDADEIDRIHEMWKRIGILTEEQWTDEDLALMASKRGVETSQWNKNLLAKNMKRVIALDPLFGDAGLTRELRLFTVSNVNLIESLRDDTIKKLETTMLADFQRGLRAEEIAKDLEEYIDPAFGNARARANLIARDQIGKLNGQLTQLRQEEIGVERYTWRTMGDSRVRDEHQELNGQVFSWSDPPSVGHPGDDYQCRCYAEPDLSAYIQ